MAAIHTTGSNEMSEMQSTVMTMLLIKNGEMSQHFLNIAMMAIS
jgi:hypothetical protein